MRKKKEEKLTQKQGRGSGVSPYKYSVPFVVVCARAIAGDDLAFSIEVGGIKELEVFIAQLAAWGKITANII